MTSPDAFRATGPRWFTVLRFSVGIMAATLTMFVGLLTGIAAAGSYVPSWDGTVVGSGSMEPSLAVGDVVFVRQRGTGDAMPTAGQVILVDRPGVVPLLHRAIGERSGLILTQGDANEHADSELVKPESVLGTAVYVVPWVGLPSLLIAAGQWATVALVALLLGMLLWLSRFGWLQRYDPWLSNEARDGSEPGDHDVGGGAEAGSDSHARATASASPVPQPARAGRHTLGRALRRVVVPALLALGMVHFASADAQFSKTVKPPTALITAGTLQPPASFTEVRTCRSDGTSDFTFTWGAHGSRLVDGYVIYSDTRASTPEVVTVKQGTTAFTNRRIDVNDTTGVPQDSVRTIVATYKSWNSAPLRSTLTRKGCPAA